MNNVTVNGRLICEDDKDVMQSASCRKVWEMFRTSDYESDTIDFLARRRVFINHFVKVMYVITLIIRETVTTSMLSFVVVWIGATCIKM